MVLTGATTSVLYTLWVQQLNRGPQLLSTAHANGTAAGPFSSSQPAQRVECDLAVRGVVGPVRWILAPGGSNEPPGVVGLLGSDWLHATGSAEAMVFDWRHGVCGNRYGRWLRRLGHPAGDATRRRRRRSALRGRDPHRRRHGRRCVRHTAVEVATHVAPRHQRPSPEAHATRKAAVTMVDASAGST